MSDLRRFRARSPRRVDKPWGYELIWAECDRYAGKLLHIDGGQALSYQYHEVKEETIYVLSGTLRLFCAEGDETPELLELGPGEAFHVKPGLRHRFEAGETVELLEVSSPELDDVVRLEDRYGRAG